MIRKGQLQKLAQLIGRILVVTFAALEDEPDAHSLKGKHLADLIVQKAPVVFGYQIGLVAEEHESGRFDRCLGDIQYLDVLTFGWVGGRRAITVSINLLRSEVETRFWASSSS